MRALLEARPHVGDHVGGGRLAVLVVDVDAAVVPRFGAGVEAARRVPPDELAVERRAPAPREACSRAETVTGGVAARERLGELGVQVRVARPPPPSRAEPALPAELGALALRVRGVLERRAAARGARDDDLVFHVDAEERERRAAGVAESRASCRPRDASSPTGRSAKLRPGAAVRGGTRARRKSASRSLCRHSRRRFSRGESS